MAARPTLSVVGAGRAGSAMAVALHEAGYEIAAVHSRTAPHAAQLAQLVGAQVAPTALTAVVAARITLLTVPDAAITPVAATVAATGAALRGHAVVHCSARLGPDVVAAVRITGGGTGVLHPLQAMAGVSSAAALRGAYYRLEASGPLEAELRDLVHSLDGHVLSVDAAHRDLYHAAAVLAGNAPLALLADAVMLLEQCGIEPQVAHGALATLLEGAAANARRRLPEQALTGPVVRGDSEAIAAHLRALAPYPEARDLYTHLVAEMQRLVAPEITPAAPALHRVA